MLSDEEKEALRNFKSEYESCDHYSSDLIIELDDAEIILNLIEKQSKEIEELKNADLTTVYLNGFYDGEKKVKDKIKAKIEIRKEEKENCKDSIEEKYLLREIYVLQSLLEKEE